MRYMLLAPAVLLAACIALYAWAAYNLHPFDEDMYD